MSAPHTDPEATQIIKRYAPWPTWIKVTILICCVLIVGMSIASIVLLDIPTLAKQQDWIASDEPGIPVCQWQTDYWGNPDTVDNQYLLICFGTHRYLAGETTCPEEGNCTHKHLRIYDQLSSFEQDRLPRPP